jgi:hypothetical protein
VRRNYVIKYWNRIVRDPDGPLCVRIAVEATIMSRRQAASHARQVVEALGDIFSNDHFFAEVFDAKGRLIFALSGGIKARG